MLSNEKECISFLISIFVLTLVQLLIYSLRIYYFLCLVDKLTYNGVSLVDDFNEADSVHTPR